MRKPRPGAGRTGRTALLVLLLGSACCAPLAQQAPAVDESSHGAWTLRCEQVDGDASAECIMHQNLVLKTGGQPVLQFAIGLAPDDDTPTVVLKLPLGIYLPPGITVRIDDGQPATFPVERCDPDGCQAIMKLRPATVRQLREGQRLEIIVHDSERVPLTMPLSLDGFARAFDELSAAPPAALE